MGEDTFEEQVRAEAERVREQRRQAQLAREAARQSQIEADRIESRLKQSAPPPPVSVTIPRLHPRARAMFTFQLSAMLGAAVHIVRALDTLVSAEDKSMRPMAAKLAELISGGRSLSAAMTALPQCFDRTYVSLVRSGEVGGCLNEVLHDLAQALERDQRLRSRVSQALAYPFFTLVVSISMAGFLLCFMLPRFMPAFIESGAELPWLTKGLMAVASHPALVMGVPLALVLVWLVLTLQQNELSVRFTLWLRYETPVLGNIFRELALSRYCNNLALLVERAVPIAQALKVQAEVCEFPALQRATREVLAELEAGVALSQAFANQPIFPRLLSSLVNAGEHSGEMAPFLKRCATILEERVDYSLTALVQMLEPVILLGMGVIVGTIVLGVLLPMYKLATVNL